MTFLRPSPQSTQRSQRMRFALRTKKGFTFIELLITLAVIAIVFVPLMRMFTASLEQVSMDQDLTTARYLIQEGMEKVKNMGLTEAQLKALGDVWDPPLDEAPVTLNKKYWRIKRTVDLQTDPLEVRILAYQLTEATLSEPEGLPEAQAATLIEDLDWFDSVE